MILSRLFRAAKPQPDTAAEDRRSAYQLGFKQGRQEFANGWSWPTTNVPRSQLSDLSRLVLDGREDGYAKAEHDAIESVRRGFDDLLRGAA